MAKMPVQRALSEFTSKMRGMSEFGPNTNRKSGVDPNKASIKGSIKGSLLLHSAGEALVVSETDKSGDFTVKRNKPEKKK